jgi:hypothetical protein
MPAALDKDARKVIVLESDKVKPVDEQPRFIFRPLAMGQWGNVLNQADSIEKSVSGLDAIAALCDVIVSAGLIDWENMTDIDGKVIRFNKKRLANIITMDEAWEIFMKLQGQGIFNK